MSPSESSFRFSFADGLWCLAVTAMHVALGPVLGQVQNPSRRRQLSLFVGLTSALLLCGSSSLYLVIVSTAASLMLYVTRTLPGFYLINFALIFACLQYYRCFHTCAQTHNILMQMSLRMISLAADLSANDSCCCEMSSKKRSPLCVTCWLPKSPPDILFYLWCHVGLMTTPVVRYRTYEQYISGDFHTSIVDRSRALWSVAKALATIFPIAFVCNHLIQMETPAKEAFFEYGLITRLLYFAAVCFTFRCRLYVGILLGEASAISLGLGVFPAVIQCKPEAGPMAVAESSSGSLDSSTVYGVHPSLELETTSIQEYTRRWNATMQGWLVRCVYKRVRGPPVFRKLATFFVSGLWHGISLGHWLFFIQLFVYIVSVEAKCSRYLDRLPHVVRWLLFNLILGYWFAAYCLLDANLIWRSYGALFFMGHIAAALVSTLM